MDLSERLSPESARHFYQILRPDFGEHLHFLLIFIGAPNGRNLAAVSFKFARLLRLSRFLNFLKLFELFIRALKIIGVTIWIFGVFVVSQELLAWLSVLEILIIKNVFLLFKLLLVFNFFDSLLILNVLLLLFNLHLEDPLIGRNFWHNSSFALKGVKPDLSDIVLWLVGNSKDEANYLQTLKSHDRNYY